MSNTLRKGPDWEQVVVDKILPIVLPWLLTNLGRLIVALITKLEASNVNSGNLAGMLTTTELIVKGINKDHPDWPDERKKQFSHDAIMLLIKNKYPEIKGGSSLVNSLIELTVLLEKTSEGQNTN